ncbi:MAG: HAMP domain-containing histidine kinase [Bacteroidia bacterium]|nr:HAMP domain-containing histidine kinase [Bacteroidia bacterium]
MSNKAYKTIVILLALALISFFTIQGLWISNSFAVAKDEIHRATFDALAAASKKLALRSNLSDLKNNFVVERDDSIPGGRSKVRIVMSSNEHDTDVNTIIHNIKPFIPVPPDVPDVPNRLLNINDSVVFLGAPKVKKYVIQQRINSYSHDTVQEDIVGLVDKMMMEVRAFDVSPLEDMKPDTLKGILTAQLREKGIESPFEFAVGNGANNDSIILSSSGFAKDKMKEAFSFSIFPDNILKKSDRLVLYYPSESSLVFSRMKTLLFLSALFALFILGLFIVTLRLILKQKKLTEIKNDFINNMTHELKTPIATISVAADALKNPKVKADSAKLDYYSAVIKEENNKMNRNVEKVLQLALTDKDGFKPEFSEVNLHELIEKCISNFEVLFASKNIKCEFFPGATNFRINADAFLFENSINNLIDNAYKYSSGEPVISIKTENKNDKIFLSIKDNGIGMNAELQKKIFEKFYRAQTGNIHDVKGFGIGLTYAYNIVKAHKGDIKVESEVGKGSTFTIEMPVKN